MRAKIQDFWSWFIENEAEFRNVKDREQAIERMDNQILAFGRFAWGIDTGREKPFALVLSPNNDPDLLDISRDIMDEAPDLKNWEFYPARLRLHDWDFKLEVYNRWMSKQTYDVRRWEFVLIEEDDYRVSVEIVIPNMNDVDAEDQQVAASRVVNLLLGEELRIEEVHRIRVVDDFDPQDEDWIYPMVEFRDRFLDFIEED